jgi:hypothetical protein
MICIYPPYQRGARIMQKMLKFLMGMIILATVVGVLYYIWQMMAGGKTEPIDVIE